MRRNITTLIAVLLLVGGAVFTFAQFFGSGSEALAQETSSAGQSAASSDAGQQLIALLDRLKNLKMDGSIFASPQFLALRDETAAINSEPVGRNNPFAPIGHDTFFVSTSAAPQTGSTSASSGASPVSASTSADTAAANTQSAR